MERALERVLNRSGVGLGVGWLLVFAASGYWPCDSPKCCRGHNGDGMPGCTDDFPCSLKSNALMNPKAAAKSGYVLFATEPRNPKIVTHPWFSGD